MDNPQHPGILRVQITFSTGGWLLAMTAFAVGFSCGCLCEEFRDLLWRVQWNWPPGVRLGQPC